jgi:hypothetical protein
MATHPYRIRKGFCPLTPRPATKIKVLNLAELMERIGHVISRVPENLRALPSGCFLMTWVGRWKFLDGWTKVRSWEWHADELPWARCQLVRVARQRVKEARSLGM